jgi:hypothetical protein
MSREHPLHHHTRSLSQTCGPALEGSRVCSFHSSEAVSRLQGPQLLQEHLLSVSLRFMNVCWWKPTWVHSSLDKTEHHIPQESAQLHHKNNVHVLLLSSPCSIIDRRVKTWSCFGLRLKGASHGVFHISELPLSVSFLSHRTRDRRCALKKSTQAFFTESGSSE